MKFQQLSFFFFICSAVLCNICNAQNESDKPTYSQISFASGDGVEITADLYVAHEDKAKPFIVLCHQAGWSRGEYREIAPKLNRLGFNCMAIDQRSGGKVKGVSNGTMARAAEANKPTTFLDAEQDMIAAIDYARKNYAEGKLILWGSSYSSALSLRIAGENAETVDGVMAFAPGEYFVRFGKPDDWIQSSASKISVPVFITSAKNEYSRWEKIFESIGNDERMKFIPESKGNHGSRALWKQFDDSDAYWEAVKVFLAKFEA